MNSQVKYCVDSNTLIEFWRHQPYDIFKKLWLNLERMIKEGRLISPELVRKEIESGSDTLIKWVKSQSIMFQKIDRDQLTILRKIMKEFPGIIDETEIYEDADPWVISLARCKTKIGIACIVVTEEKIKNYPPNLTYVCSKYKMPFMKGFDLIRNEGWKF